MRAVFVRAGPCAFGGRVAGALDVPLAPEGQARARNAAEKVRLFGGAAAVYGPASGFAHEAAKLISEELGADARAREGLRELDLGLWQGLLEEELSERHPDAFRAFRREAPAVVPPGGEEVGFALERVEDELVSITRKHRREERPVVIVVGPLAFELLLAAAEGRDTPPDLWARSGAGEDVRELLLPD